MITAEKFTTSKLSTYVVRFRSHEISRAENHHPPIIYREAFDLVQEMKKKRSNIELDEHGNKVRKSTHYSMKRLDNEDESPTGEV